MRADSSNALQVRPARAADIDFLVGANAAMAVETEGKQLDADTLRRGVERCFADASKGRYYIAESGGAALGCLLITLEWSDWRDGWFWWIQSVYVSPEARARGVFSALYAFIEAAARADSDVCGIRLYVERDNERAQRTYARLGMSETDYRMYAVTFGAES